ncbi:MAG: hypothetical protein ACR2OI_04555, partial [Acidimicrobiia bacterium]
WDPDPTDSSYLMELSYRLQEDGRPDSNFTEIHELGLFPRATWLDAMRESGLEPYVVSSKHSDLDHPVDVFVGAMPPAAVGR